MFFYFSNAKRIYIVEYIPRARAFVFKKFEYLELVKVSDVLTNS